MLHVFVLLASSTGMRVGELKQLRWGDLEIRQMDDGTKRLVVSVRAETSKVRRGRTAVAHSDHIISVLDEFKKVSVRTDSTDLIFYSERDGEVGEVDLSTAFKTFLKILIMRVGQRDCAPVLMAKHARFIHCVTSMRSSV